MNAHRIRLGGLLVVGAAIGLALACGQSSGPGENLRPAPSGMGQFAVAVVNAPIDNTNVSNANDNAGGVGEVNVHGATAVVVNVTKVTAHSTASGWFTVSSTPVTVDLLTLETQALNLGLVNLQPGTITQVRLYVTAEGNYATVGGQNIPLKVPSGTQSGIKINGPWEVTPCSQTALTLEFDGHNAIFAHPARQGTEYILRPVIRVKKVVASDIPCNDNTNGNANENVNVNVNVNENVNTNENVNENVNANTNTNSNTNSNPPACDTASPCAEGYACVNGTCVGEPGTACTEPYECLSGTCDPTQVCAPGGVGTPCAAAGDCLSNVCTQNTCAPGGPGAPCTANGDCASNVCTNQSCGPGTAAGPGTSCTDNAQCLSNTCNNGVCDPSGQGQPCVTNNDCQAMTECTTAKVCEPMVVGL